jgi:uncharacterized protein (TIGR03083 family)
MDEEAVWQAVDRQRLTVAGMLAGLSDDQWRHPSLCAGWTVRDVAGHLAWQQRTSLPAILRDFARARGDLNRTIHDASCRWATRPTDRLVEEIRTLVGRRWHPPGLTHLEVLIDILVHGQDVAVPLGLELDLPPAAVAAAATRVWANDKLFGARAKLGAYRLVATDTSWSAGTGVLVEGPIDALLLLLTGRTEAASPSLTGADVQPRA